jgi:DNA ligase-1
MLLIFGIYNLQMKEFYSEERILPKKPVYYKTDEQPEVWFTTEQVWEIRGAGNL